MRRFSIWAIIGICALTAIWSALWFYARGLVESQVDRVLAGSLSNDPTVLCEERTIGGYPFRLILACSPAGMRLNSGDLSVDLSALNVTALAYNPKHVVAEYSAPLTVTPGNMLPVRANWSKGLSSVRISGQSFSIFSTLFENLAVSGPNSAFKTTEAQFHARPLVEEGLTDLAVSADHAEFSLNGQTSAPFFFAMTTRINATPEFALAGSFPGGSPSFQNIDIRFWHEKTYVSATGNLTVADNGMSEGEFLITAKDLKDLAAFLQTLPDQMKTPAQQTVGYLISLGRPGKDENGEPVSQLTLSVRGNEIFAGNRLIANLGPGS